VLGGWRPADGAVVAAIGGADDHVLRLILPNAFTVVVALFGILLTGAITMEVVFGLPGLGTLTLQTIQGRDYSLVQAVVIWLGMTVVIANLLSDLVQRAFDPRIGR